MNQILEYLQTQQPAMVATLEAWVNQDSPTYNKDLVDIMGQMTVQAFADAGATLTQTHPQTEFGNHYTMTYGEGDSQILLLDHFDTVWPVDEAKKRPFAIKDGVATGPGIHDMKAGTVISLFALKAIQKLGLKPRHKLVYLLTGDEEISSPTSRPIIEAEAKQSAYCLVFEGAVNRGLTTARKGIGRFQIQITGLSAHVGIEPEKGISAIEELARQIQTIHALSDYERGISLNIGLISGGERPNMVAPHAQAEIDLRIKAAGDADKYADKILNLQPILSGTDVKITGKITRRPFEETPDSLALFEKAKSISERLGMPTHRVFSGGGSDGNFAAALGVPTLDGLGSIGGGAHALTEHTIIDQLPKRAALAAELIMQL